MIEDIQSTEVKPTAAPLLIASFGQRLGNYLLDLVFIYVAAFFIGLFLVIIGQDPILDQLGSLFGFVLMFLYYIPQEGLFGWTLGKLITGTRVVREDGTPISLGQAIGRTLCRFIPFEAFTFLGGNGLPVGWHDKLPNTRVISVRKRK